MLRSAAILLILAACTRHAAHSSQPVPDEKEAFYAAALTEKIKTTKYVHSRCDDILFRCLAFYSGVNLDYLSYSDGSGRWYRDSNHNCLDTGESSSDFSQDMMKGLELCFIKAKDLDSANKTIDYLDTHFYMMGRGDVTRAFMSPLQMKQLYAVRDYIATGTTLSLAARDDSADGVLVKTGFEAHLQVLSIFIDSLVYGGVSSLQLQILKSQAGRQPRNGLFQAMYGRFSNAGFGSASSILADEMLFPSGRLPRSTDRSEDYLWQRDDVASDWGPSSEDKEHFGVDYLFARGVIK